MSGRAVGLLLLLAVAAHAAAPLAPADVRVTLTWTNRNTLAAKVQLPARFRAAVTEVWASVPDRDHHWTFERTGRGWSGRIAGASLRHAMATALTVHVERKEGAVTCEAPVPPNAYY